MGFIMDGLDAEAYDRTYTDRALVERILGYFKKESRRMVFVAVAILLGAGLETALPIAVSLEIDQVARAGTFPPLEQLVVGASILAVLASAAWAINWARQQVSAVAVGNVVIRLREDAFDAVL